MLSEIERANLLALDREIKAALQLAAGHGLVSVNVMRAVNQYGDYMRQACASGAGAITIGAGLPLDLKVTGHQNRATAAVSAVSIPLD